MNSALPDQLHGFHRAALLVGNAHQIKTNLQCSPSLNGHTFSGKISEVYLWTRVLNEEEIQMVYAQRTQNVCLDGLLFWWHMFYELLPADGDEIGLPRTSDFDGKSFEFP